MEITLKFRRRAQRTNYIPLMMAHTQIHESKRGHPLLRTYMLFTAREVHIGSENLRPIEVLKSELTSCRYTFIQLNYTFVQFNAS